MAAKVTAAGRRAVAVPANLNDLDAVAALVDHARASFGRLDLVVNNVGGTMPQAFMETSPKTLEAAFHFNVATAHTLLQAAVPLMLEGGGGSAVNISSAMGRMADRGFVAYGTAKGALAHYTRLAATDLAPPLAPPLLRTYAPPLTALPVPASPPAPPGWYEVGGDPRHLGWWDGHAWTHPLRWDGTSWRPA